ncbi:MAG: hypothetical protein JW724_04240 [Candidatus Altiarchaeota archaeon]|nr:hypothetical protein [Candidatus Altiarchaeota archaeon]
MLNLKIIWTILALSCMLAGTAAAEGLTVKKTCAPEIKLGDVLEVSITIKNGLGESLNLDVREYMVDAETIEAPEAQREVEPVLPANKSSVIYWFTPYYQWIFNLKPAEEKTLAYRIRPQSLGKLNIGPTEVRTPRETYYSNILTVTVKCNANKVCEGKFRENSINCPEDCPSGFNDGLCNPIEDKTCDPDCPANTDPDCTKPVCGDRICEGFKGEDHGNCPADCVKPIVCGDGACERAESHASCPNDCPSGGKDNYCDALKDGVCDPDCPPKTDPDCKDACGNLICEYKAGENHNNCPVDCPSGVRDGFCDRLVDGICDPDCAGSIDPDCKGDNTIYLIILAALMFLIGIVIYKKLKKRGGG